VLGVPLKFKEIPKGKVWGDERLRTLFGKPFPAGVHIGESWEVSAHGEDVSVVAEGPLEGRTLADLAAEDPPALLGGLSTRKGGAFPLLIKLLDTRSALSVQVHPSDELAREMGVDDAGKTEAWHVLHADPGAVMFHGLQHGVDREAFEQMIRDDRVERALRCFPVRPGDTIFCPAGTVHAIGAGLTLFEIQQSSDTTFRVFDWGRLEDPANPRPLHIEESLRAINFGDQPPRYMEPEQVPVASGECERLVVCPKFEIQRWRFAGRTSVAAPDSFEILCIAAGACVVSAGGESLRLKASDSVLFPAVVREWAVAPEPEVVALRVTVPDLP